MIELVIGVFVLLAIIFLIWWFQKVPYQVIISELPGKTWLVDGSYYLQFENIVENPQVWRSGMIGGQWSTPEGNVKVTKLDIDKKVLFSKNSRWYSSSWRSADNKEFKLGIEISVEGYPSPSMEPPFGYNAPIKIILDEQKFLRAPTFKVYTTVTPSSYNGVMVTPDAIFGKLTNASMVPI